MRPSKVSNTQVAEIWNNASVLRQTSCALAASKQRQVTLEEVKYLALSCLAEWLFVKIVHGEDYMLFVCSLRSLLSSQPMYCPATPHTASSDIKKVLVLDQLQAPPCHWLRTMWKSRAAQAFATTIDWRSDGVSNRRSTRKTGDFLGHAQEFV